MRTIGSVFFISMLFGLTAHAALPFEQLLYKGKAVPFYNDSINPDQQKYIDAVRSSDLAERMSSLVSNSLRLKSNIGIGFESCGRINAFFNPQRRVIVICSEFIDMIAKTAFNDKSFMMKLPKE